jgi:hypothetical protein
LTLKPIPPKAKHFQLAMLVMCPPLTGFTRGLTEKGGQHEKTEAADNLGELLIRSRLQTLTWRLGI